MTRIDRYVLEKTLMPLGATVGIALAALLMERMVRLMELLVSQGGPFLLIIKMLSNLVPHYLGLALPAALFLGIMMATTRLSMDSELDALQAVGVGLRRLLWPIMGLAFVLSLVVFILYGFLQPHTRYAYRALFYAATHSMWELALDKGSFFSGIGNYTVLIDDIEEGGRRLGGVFVYQKLDDGGSVTMTAASGTAFRAPDDPRIVLRLQNGVRFESRPGDERASSLIFEQFDVPLDIGEIEPFRARWGERELTLFELWEQRHTEGARPSKYDIRAELWGRIVRALSLLLLPLLAVPLGLAAKRNQRGAGIAIGIVALVLYHHTLNFGETLTAGHRVSAFVGLWVPFLVFNGASLWLFLAVSARPRENPVAMLLASLDNARRAVIGLFRRHEMPA